MEVLLPFICLGGRCSKSCLIPNLTGDTEWIPNLPLEENLNFALFQDHQKQRYSEEKALRTFQTFAAASCLSSTAYFISHFLQLMSHISSPLVTLQSCYNCSHSGALFLSAASVETVQPQGRENNSWETAKHPQ